LENGTCQPLTVNPMHRAIYPLKWDIKKRQEIHKKKLRNTKHLIDTESPRPMTHLVTKAKKHELEEDRFSEIERENAVLLSKMSRIIREGSGSHNNGGAPPRAALKPAAPKSLNRGHRRKELERITQENLSMLQRIQLKDPFYNHLDWAQERRENEKVMLNLCEYKTTRTNSKFVESIRQNASGSQSARAASARLGLSKQASGALTDRSQRHHGLQRVRVDDIKLLLGMKRPPDLVKKVFSSLMLLVSPFETAEADLSWAAVQQWLAALRSVESFVDNLNHFDVRSVDPAVIGRTVDYLVREDLKPDSVALFSAALSSLAAWIWEVCEASVPGIVQAREQARDQKDTHGEVILVDEDTSVADTP